MDFADTHRDWHRADIIAEVRKRGSNLRRLAFQHGYASSSLSASLIRRSPPANLVIARFLGVSRHELWPNWYGPDDEVLPLDQQRQAS
jgi:Ner family transcriptional regulator